MNPQTFTLKPFPGSEPIPNITLTALVTRTEDNHLRLIYEIRGAIDRIRLPQPNPSPQRQWDLWETTCFECFLGQPSQSNYWEFNLAPNRNWNIFALRDYRTGIQEAPEIDPPTIATGHNKDQFTLIVESCLDRLIPPYQPIELAITAVIQDQQNQCTYWAIAHTAPEPDFHQRNSFIIQL